MKNLARFALNKYNPLGLHIHYLRVGNASKLLDNLKIETNEFIIQWKLDEIKNFREFHFSQSYFDNDASIVNLEIDDDNYPTLRKEFWEDYIWKTEQNPLITAIVIPNSNNPGSLTKAELFEILSLTRLTDRAFELFEYKEGVEKKIITWISNLASIIHKKERIDDISIDE